MGPVQTLHDFALNLLSDPQALADFNADPQAVLSAAGLDDVSAADVHEIMPLVMDLAPASVTDSLSSFDAAGDVTGTLDTARAALANATAPLGGILGDLPNLSGVFGAVSDVAEQTGLNTVTHEALGAVSDVVDGVADAVSGVPIAGPVLEAGAIDLENTVSAVGDHLFDGKLVGASVDALTNHLGDALMPGALVDTVSQLPAVGAPLGGLLEDVRTEGSALLGTVNAAIGSTPVGMQGGDLVSDLSVSDLSSVNTTLNTVTDSVSENLGNLPLVGGAVSGAIDAASGVVDTATTTVGDFAATGDLSGTLDQVTSALPAAPALPAVGDVVDSVNSTVGGLAANAPAVGDVVGSVGSTVGGLAANAPVVGDVVNSVGSTVGDVTAHVPAVGNVMNTAMGTVGNTSVADIHQDVTSHVANLHSTVSGLASDLNVGHVADVPDLHAADGLLGDLHLGQ
ncbi:IniB N-terminal domain-containing protein [Amycolatopsis taiwanensis]|uniref:Uncharacterized protein n=1 Tax=Amycolatopsis taiwanensis TaxID=342230 RepID=A0A9W6VDS6_9PSEU|nr:IniB N-terminal domain-containing protein [Amycolatopsis taiwanensis]GLY65060.1 hypothetical protein Atai01_16790 [Amycolatopsis taiwanensis]